MPTLPKIFRPVYLKHTYLFIWPKYQNLMCWPIYSKKFSHLVCCHIGFQQSMLLLKILNTGKILKSGKIIRLQSCTNKPYKIINIFLSINWTCVSGAQKNRLVQMVLLSIQKHMFLLRNKKMVIEVWIRLLSLNQGWQSDEYRVTKWRKILLEDTLYRSVPLVLVAFIVGLTCIWSVCLWWLKMVILYHNCEKKWKKNKHLCIFTLHYFFVLVKLFYFWY